MDTFFTNDEYASDQEYRNITMYGSITNERKAMVDELLGCGDSVNGLLSSYGQPTIYASENAMFSVFIPEAGACNSVMVLKENHSSLLVHEFVHYWEYALPFRTDNSSAIGQAYHQLCTSTNACTQTPTDTFYDRTETYPEWGDGPGWPYFYARLNMHYVPNAQEYIAILFEGYCMNGTDPAPGPSRAYLNNASNPIAQMQRGLIDTILNYSV